LIAIIVVVVLVVLAGGLAGLLLVRSSGDADVVVSESAASTQPPSTQPPSTQPPATQPDQTPPTTPIAPLTPSPFAQPTDPGQPADGADQSVFELAVGTCFNDPGSAEEIQQVAAVPCEAAHDNEVFALVDFPAGAEDPFPGRESVSSFGDEQCQGQLFDDYVGIAYIDSAFFVTQLTPTEGSWEQGDREIVCLLYEPTTQITGSVRGSGR
ncbi:MAG TPA: septum formation family protein, partial [Euzebya sp.]|nr:septum formation family protein [Euzebya sp.]